MCTRSVSYDLQTGNHLHERTRWWGALAVLYGTCTPSVSFAPNTVRLVLRFDVLTSTISSFIHKVLGCNASYSLTVDEAIE